MQNQQSSQNNKKIFFLFISIIINCFQIYGKDIDTISCRVLYHPHSYSMYSLHDRVDQVFLDEVFFIMKRNKIVYPGLTTIATYTFDTILAQFDSILCTDDNKVIAFSEESQKRMLEVNKYQFYFKSIHDSTYYQGLHFYAFDVVIIIDSTKGKQTDLLLDLKHKYQSRFIKKQIELSAIVRFLEIKPVYLKKHKLKKNGKIYPVK